MSRIGVAAFVALNLEGNFLALQTKETRYHMSIIFYFILNLFLASFIYLKINLFFLIIEELLKLQNNYIWSR